MCDAFLNTWVNSIGIWRLHERDWKRENLKNIPNAEKNRTHVSVGYNHLNKKIVHEPYRRNSREEKKKCWFKHRKT